MKARSALVALTACTALAACGVATRTAVGVPVAAVKVPVKVVGAAGRIAF